MEFTDVISVGTVKYNVNVAPTLFCLWNIFVGQSVFLVYPLGSVCALFADDNVPALVWIIAPPACKFANVTVIFSSPCEYWLAENVIKFVASVGAAPIIEVSVITFAPLLVLLVPSKLQSGLLGFAFTTNTSPLNNDNTDIVIKRIIMLNLFIVL